MAAFYVIIPNDQHKMHTTNLIVCDDDTPPEAFQRGADASTHVLCALTTNLGQIPAHKWEHHVNSIGIPYKTITYEIGLCLESGGLRFDLRVDDVVYGNVTASFD